MEKVRKKDDREYDGQTLAGYFMKLGILIMINQRRTAAGGKHSDIGVT